MKFISYLFSPLAFGIGFFAPLIAQVLESLNLSIAGIDNMYTGLILGLIFGLTAQLRGSWIWIKPQ